MISFYQARLNICSHISLNIQARHIQRQPFERTKKILQSIEIKLAVKDYNHLLETTKGLCAGRGNGPLWKGADVISLPCVSSAV